MLENHISQIATAIVAALGGAGAWRYYQTKLELKNKSRAHFNREQNMFRDDLRERVAILEQKLEEAQEEKEKTAKELSLVLSQLAEYRVRIEFLERENERLRSMR